MSVRRDCRRQLSGYFSGDFSGDFSGGPFFSPKFFRACAALAWFHLSSYCTSDYVGRVVGEIDVSGLTERSAYEW